MVQQCANLFKKKIVCRSNNMILILSWEYVSRVCDDWTSYPIPIDSNTAEIPPCTVAPYSTCTVVAPSRITANSPKYDPECVDSVFVCSSDNHHPANTIDTPNRSVNTTPPFGMPSWPPAIVPVATCGRVASERDGAYW
jgi:hypothetical protein